MLQAKSALSANTTDRPHVLIAEESIITAADNAVEALELRAHLCTKHRERAACSLLQHSGAIDEK